MGYRFNYAADYPAVYPADQPTSQPHKSVGNLWKSDVNNTRGREGVKDALGEEPVAAVGAGYEITRVAVRRWLLASSLRRCVSLALGQ